MISRNHAFALGAQIANEFVQQFEPHIQRTLEALFLLGDSLQYELAPGFQLGEIRAHYFDDHLGNFGQEGLLEADLPPEASSPAQDHTQHVVTPIVARQDPVADQESHRPAVISDDAVAHNVGLAFVIGVPQHVLNSVHDGSEQVGVVVGENSLQHRRNSLQAHAGVNVLGGQLMKDAVFVLVVLDKDQVPQLEEAPAAAVHCADMVGVIPQIAGFLSPVEVNFAAGATRSGLAHLPEIILTPKIEDVIGVYVGYFPPVASCLLIGPQISFVILEHRNPETAFRQSPHLGKEFPCPGDGLFFVIVAKGPIAEHLEERVMIGIIPDILEIVVLPGDPQALLCIGCSRVLALLQSQENVLELIHACVCEQQCGIISRYQRSAGNDSMPLAGEEIQERLPDLRATHCHKLFSSRCQFASNSVVILAQVSHNVKLDHLFPTELGVVNSPLPCGRIDLRFRAKNILDIVFQCIYNNYILIS